MKPISWQQMRWLQRRYVSGPSCLSGCVGGGWARADKTARGLRTAYRAAVDHFQPKDVVSAFSFWATASASTSTVCGEMEAKYKLKHCWFLAWNLSVLNDCESSFRRVLMCWVERNCAANGTKVGYGAVRGYDYCVGIPSFTQASKQCRANRK